ncbi:MAG: N-acetylmuramoyl-L-alanine amidase [Clostridia bacterium]|nr:N-acetylmuramoyl-L-alanine amidase [Clostridia bacterium]
MRNSQAARRQETTRRILVIAIFALLLGIIFISIKMIASKSCSNPGQSGMLPTDTPAPTSPTPAPSASAVPATAIPSASPYATVVPETPTPTPVPTPSPTPEQNRYGIPRLVTEGSMNDVLARLEQFKTIPSSETLILLDVGHGGFDPGTAGLESGITEADLNLQISRRLAEKLAAKGYFVFMTRMGDYGCANNKQEDMNLRTRIMRLDIFDASVSIHQNSYVDDRSAHGVRLYHYKAGSAGAKYAKDEKLASCILQSICAMTEENRSHTDTGNFMVCREPHAPAALVECGFLSNSEDEKKLSDPSYQEVFSQAIANGVENYLNGAN